MLLRRSHVITTINILDHMWTNHPHFSIHPPTATEVCFQLLWKDQMISATEILHRFVYHLHFLASTHPPRAPFAVFAMLCLYSWPPTTHMSRGSQWLRLRSSTGLFIDSVSQHPPTHSTHFGASFAMYLVLSCLGRPHDLRWSRSSTGLFTISTSQHPPTHQEHPPAESPRPSSNRPPLLHPPSCALYFLQRTYPSFCFFFSYFCLSYFCVFPNQWNPMTLLSSVYPVVLHISLTRNILGFSNHVFISCIFCNFDQWCPRTALIFSVQLVALCNSWCSPMFAFSTSEVLKLPLLHNIEPVTLFFGREDHQGLSLFAHNDLLSFSHGGPQKVDIL